MAVVRLLLAGFGRRLPRILEERLNVAASKPLDSSDRVTGQLASSYHAVDSHRRQLQQFSQLTDGVKLRLVVVSRSCSLHQYFLPSPRLKSERDHY